MHMHDFLLPLEAIRKRPYPFVSWVLGVAGLGLIGFWLPLVVRPGDRVKVADVFQQLVRAGVLPSFGVVFVSSAIAETLARNIANYDDHTARLLYDLRAITVVVCLIVMVAQTGLLSNSLIDDAYQRSGLLQGVLVATSLALGCYLYCFRYFFREPVDNHLSEENAETKHLGETAKTAAEDSSGVKL